MQLESQAPGWVNWVAQDANGAWWGFEVQPLPAYDYWYENEVGRYVALAKGEPNLQWETTLRVVRRDSAG